MKSIVECCIILAMLGSAGTGRLADEILVSNSQPSHTSNEALGSPTAAEPSFAELIRISEGPTSVPRSRYSQRGRFWGEYGGSIRSLIQPTMKPAFRWKGKVDEYLVLAFDGEHLTLLDCGLPNSRTVTKTIGKVPGSLEERYLVLSLCSGPGRVRVVQPMNIKSYNGRNLV